MISNSYIDPNFKKYPVLDNYITQRLFAIIAQDEDIPRSVNDLQQLVNELLTSESTIRPSNH